MASKYIHPAPVEDWVTAPMGDCPAAASLGRRLVDWLCSMVVGPLLEPLGPLPSWVAGAVLLLVAALLLGSAAVLVQTSATSRPATQLAQRDTPGGA